MELKEYKEYLERKKLRPRSIETYLYMMNELKSFLGKPLDKSITRQDLERYLDSIKNQSSSSIITKMNSIRLYFKWLYEIKGKHKFPEIVDWFEYPKNHNNRLLPSDLITGEELDKLIAVCDNLRDRAIVCLLFESALRKSELVSLNIEDVHMEDNQTGYITVRKSKTEIREVPLSRSVPLLINWLNLYPSPSPNKPLFIILRHDRNYGKRLSDQYINLLLDKIAKASGIGKNLFPHLMRHSRLTDLDKKGLSHTALRVFAGWSPTSSMPTRYSHFSSADTKKAVQEADGIKPKTAEKIKIDFINCVKCSTPNDKTNRYCYLCGMALDEDSKKEFEIEELLKLMIKTDPSLSKTISEKIKQIKSVS
jgi:site-specific recombinase XerD